MPSFPTWIQSKSNDLCQGNHQKSVKNLLKKSSELEFSSGELLMTQSKKAAFKGF